MKRFLAVMLGITIASLTTGMASLGATPESGVLASPTGVVGDSRSTTQLDCYWIFWGGRWICIG